MDISATDGDGDKGNIGEFIESDGNSSYSAPFPTSLTLTNKVGGRIKVQEPVYNKVSIDTLAIDVKINYLYNGVNKIHLKIGQTVLGPGTGWATQRLNSIYFKRVLLTPFLILSAAPAGFSQE